MFKNKWEIGYSDYSTILMIILSFLTIVVTIVYPVKNVRLVYLVFYFYFLNFIVLTALSIITNFIKKIYSNRVSKFLFIFISTLYFASYVASLFTFIFTNQSIRIQTILFAYKTQVASLFILGVMGILILILIISFLLYKKISFSNSAKTHNKVKKYIISIFIICVIIVFITPYIVEINSKMIKEYSKDSNFIFEVSNIKSDSIIGNKTSIENPNVIFILLESVSDEHIYYYGYERNITPNIDKIASRGIVFRNAYATATHSDYAQPAYLTSDYILNSDYRNFFNYGKSNNSIWQILKEKNYTTYYISSQDDLWAGMNNFFDYESLDKYWYSLSDNETDYGIGLGRKDFDHKTMDVAIKTLIDYENIEQKNPFFMYINLQATHQPYAHPDEYIYYSEENNIEINKYDNSLMYVDAQIGRLLEYLDDTNNTNNTIIILSSDHGHDVYGLHNSLGHGYSIYEDEIRIPLVFLIPDMEHKEILDRVSHIDVLPTFLDIANIDSDRNFSGGIMKKNERIFFYTQNHLSLIGMIENDTKYIIDLNRNLIEVYNLVIDPMENINIFDENKYDDQIKTLLMWHRCQLRYFNAIDKDMNIEKYCLLFNK